MEREESKKRVEEEKQVRKAEREKKKRVREDEDKVHVFFKYFSIILRRHCLEKSIIIIPYSYHCFLIKLGASLSSIKFVEIDTTRNIGIRYRHSNHSDKPSPKNKI